MAGCAGVSVAAPRQLADAAAADNSEKAGSMAQHDSWPWQKKYRRVALAAKAKKASVDEKHGNR